MNESSPQPLFTAERARRRSQGAAAEAPVMAWVADAEPADEAQVRHREIMAALADLAQRFETMRGGTVALPVATDTPPTVPVACRESMTTAADGADMECTGIERSGLERSGLERSGLERADAAALREEVRALHAAIDHTRREIAALRQMGKPPAHLATATDELDAVVHATESATECILAASERIDELLTALRKQAAPEAGAHLDEIGEQVTRIFESCNFQDITGQRITKVVNALKFVEERVSRMIDVLGGVDAIEQAEAEEPVVPEKPADDESHLLCGPQLDRHKISQDDIDRFFN